MRAREREHLPPHLGLDGVERHSVEHLVELGEEVLVADVERLALCRAHLLHLCVVVRAHLYIYSISIYIQREREREIEICTNTYYT